MKNIDKISHVNVRFVHEKDDKMEVKVYIKNHIYREANIRVDQQDLIVVEAVKKKGSIRKAENWMNNNKDFVLQQINTQFPTFWDEE